MVACSKVILLTVLGMNTYAHMLYQTKSIIWLFLIISIYQLTVCLLSLTAAFSTLGKMDCHHFVTLWRAVRQWSCNVHHRWCTESMVTRLKLKKNLSNLPKMLLKIHQTYHKMQWHTVFHMCHQMLAIPFTEDTCSLYIMCLHVMYIYLVLL